MLIGDDTDSRPKLRIQVNVAKESDHKRRVGEGGGQSKGSPSSSQLRTFGKAGSAAGLIVARRAGVVPLSRSHALSYCAYTIGDLMPLTTVLYTASLAFVPAGCPRGR